MAGDPQDADMRRKDCDHLAGFGTHRRLGSRRCESTVLVARTLPLCVALLSSLPAAFGGTVRLWSNAVVTDAVVRLDDIAELRGFDAEAGARVAGTIVTEAPTVGGTRVIELSLVRAALATHRINLASITVCGASRCELSRPSELAPENAAPAATTSRKPIPSSARSGGIGGGNALSAASALPSDVLSLRKSVIEFFNEAVRRYQARAEVSFDGVSEQVLDLAAPTYTFRVRNSSRQLIGLVPVEVDVLSGDRIVQTVSLSVRLTVLRDTIVARRAINQDATIQASDVELLPMSLSRFEDLPANDLTQVVGQRAKRFISSGAVVDAGSVAAVPLVLRGQLVTLVSEVGGVRVVTAGKAAADGKLGEVIRVRSTDRRQAEFDAVVTGPGQARIAQEASASVSGQPTGGQS